MFEGGLSPCLAGAIGLAGGGKHCTTVLQWLGVLLVLLLCQLGRWQLVPAGPLPGVPRESKGAMLHRCCSCLLLLGSVL